MYIFEYSMRTRITKMLKYLETLKIQQLPEGQTSLRLWPPDDAKVVGQITKETEKIDDHPSKTIIKNRF